MPFLRSSFATALLLIVCCTASSQEPPKAATGSDALPKSARLQFGSTRFLSPSTVIELAVSPDGKTVVSIGREWLIVWDAKTGLERWRANESEGRFCLVAAAYGMRSLAFNPNGQYFYTPGAAEQIVKWNVQSGDHEQISVRAELPAFQNLKEIVFGQNVTRAVDVTSDGQRLVVGSDRGLVLCDIGGKVRHTIRNAPANLITHKQMNRDRLTFAGDYSYGVFSPDGTQVAAVLSEAPKEIRLLDAATGEEIRRITLSDKLVRLVFSPDGKQIATTERDCSARLYEIATGREVWAFEVPPAPRAESYTCGLAFSPEGETLALCAPIGSDYAIYLLDGNSGQQRQKLNGHQWKPWAVKFSPDGKILYSAGWDGNIRRWDSQTGEQLPLPAGIYASGVVAISAAAPLLAYEDDRGKIHLVDSVDGKQVRTWELAETDFEQIAFSPDGNYIAAGGTFKDQVRVAVWDMEFETKVADWQWPKGRDEHSGVEALRFSPDSKKLAAAVFRQDAAYLWNVSSGKQIAKLDHQEIYGLSFHPNGDSLVTVGWDSVIVTWDAKTGASRSATMASDGDDAAAPDPQQLSFAHDNDLRMYSVDHSADGKLIATAHMNASARVWNSDDMKLVTSFSMDGSMTYDALRFSPEKEWIATGSAGGTVSLRNARTGEKVWTSRSHQGNVYSVAFGRTASELVSGADDGRVFLWNPELNEDAKLENAVAE